MTVRRRVSHRIKILIAILAVVSITFVVFFGHVRAAYQAARVHQAMARHDWPQTIAALDGYPERFKETARWHFLRAKTARRNGDTRTAIVHLERAEALGWPKEETARQRLLLEAQTDIRRVEKQLRAAAIQGATDEEAEEIYEAMSRGYMHALLFHDAMACLNYWIDWQPSNPLPHLWKGDLYKRKELFVHAAEEYELALKYDSTSETARLSLAEVRLKQWQIPEATALFQQCEQEGENRPLILLGLADCNRRQGEEAEARLLLHEVLALDVSADEEAQACAMLARFEREDGRFERALPLFSKSLALNPNDMAVRSDFAGALGAAGQTELAEQQRKLAKESSDRYERLVELLKMVEEKPEDADLRCEVGGILLEQGLTDTGLQWLETALKLSPKHAVSHRLLADYYRRQGTDEEAERHEALAAPKTSEPTVHQPKGD